MSVFNLKKQNQSLDAKIVAGLERLSHVFRVLIWQQAKEQGLSPIQIQLLIFIAHHRPDMSTVSHLAEEFDLTKATISDAIKALEQKGYIKKNTSDSDTRSYTIVLTATGQKIVKATEDYTKPLSDFWAAKGEKEKQMIWQNISNLILSLNQSGVITIQRTCGSCIHFQKQGKDSYCLLLKQKLAIEDIRIDCPEHEVFAA